MKKVINERTGQPELQFSGTLLSISDNVFQNSNNKNYRIVAIEFADKDGVAQKASAIIYEGNYSRGVKVGENYLCTARKGEDNQVYIQMSHLTSVDRPTANMFDFDVVEETVSETAEEVVGETRVPTSLV